MWYKTPHMVRKIKEEEIIFQIFVKYEASQGYGYCYF